MSLRHGARQRGAHRAVGAGDRRRRRAEGRRRCRASSNLITFDMGGTSTDVALIEDGAAEARRRDGGARLSVEDADARHPHRRRRRRLDRPSRCRRPPEGRAAQRRRRARARSATASATASRRSPTPTSCCRRSTRRICSAGAWPIDQAKARGRHRARSPTRSGSIPWRRRRASSASSPPTWPRRSA